MSQRFGITAVHVITPPALSVIKNKTAAADSQVSSYRVTKLDHITS